MGQQEYDEWSERERVERINHLNAPVLNEKEKELIDSINPKKILDIGCGKGVRLFDYLNNRNINFVGIEKFERLVDRSPYSDSIIIGDLLEINTNNQLFNEIDTITILGGSLNGIFGIDNHKKAWTKICEILPTGGNIIFDHLIIDCFEYRDEIGERRLMPNIPHQFFLSEKQLKNIWSEFNINILRYDDFTIPAPYILRYYVLSKK